MGNFNVMISICLLLSIIFVVEFAAGDNAEVNVPAARNAEVRGAVGGASNLVDNSFIWNPQNFAGFFYDIKKDIGTETLYVVLSGDNGRTLSGDVPYGITYTTHVQQKAYERSLWGAFSVIGFQADQYFAGYVPGNTESDGSNIFYQETTDKNSLFSEQLQMILMNSKDEMTVDSGTTLNLGENYKLDVKNLDENGLHLELSKDGAVVDSKVVTPSKPGATELDKTYYYKNPKVGEQKNLVTIGVHFKNAATIQNRTFVSIDGIWQISDTPTEVKVDSRFDNMTITRVDATNGIITMNNKDEPITLTKNKDTVLMPGINIKTADNDTLRFCIYKLITKPGTYAIRGSIAGTVHGANNLIDGDSFTWDTQNFSSFFYDINEDIGTETLKTVLSGNDGRKLSGDSPYGITYITTAQSKAYERALWGAFSVISFMGDQYFAGYLQGDTEEDGSNLFYAESTDSNSLFSEQLEKILINSKDEINVTSGTTLNLGENYKLDVKNLDENGLYLELFKNGTIIDSKVLTPSKPDKTYYYKNPQVGEQSKLVTIAIHFKNAETIQNQTFASIDGFWQISDTPTSVKVGTKYDNMTITDVDAINGVITMNNKNEPITLTKNKDIVLMHGVGLKVANNNTLRFYIYKPTYIPTS
jgi:S-layer protein (TIGR01567 family)